MRRMIILSLALLCGSFGALYANECVDSGPCVEQISLCEEAPYFYSGNCNAAEPCPCPSPTIGGFLRGNFFQCLGFEASALYWRVSRDDRVYALTQTTTTAVNDNLHLVKPENHWGWRVRAKYCLPCCAFADVEYTDFKARDHDTTVAPAGLNPFSYFAVAPELAASITTHYQRAKARLGWHIWNGCSGRIYATGAASWIRVSEKDQLTATPTAFLSQKSWFNGAGLEAGIGGVFTPLRCWGIRSELNGVGAIGNRHTHFTLATNTGTAPATTIVHRPTVTQLLPGIDLVLETFYSMNFCVPIVIAVGYEYHHLFNAIELNDLFGLGFTDKVIVQNNHDLGFGGVYFSLKVNY